MDQSLQQRYAPESICFGCGPANPTGLHVASYPKGDVIVASWQPKPCYEAFPGMLNGGIIGALLDCHSNWSAAWYIMQARDDDVPPCTVTADYAIKLLRPTPTDGAIKLKAGLASLDGDRATISAELIAADKVCATCHGTFVAVKPGHPAYHRW